MRIEYAILLSIRLRELSGGPPAGVKEEVLDTALISVPVTQNDYEQKLRRLDTFQYMKRISLLFFPAMVLLN